MPCPTTSRRSPPSGAVSSGCGGGASAGAARKTAPPGRRSTGSSLDGFPNPASLILGQKSGSPSPTQGGSRMPESGTSGSVRGVRSNAHPYRDKDARCLCLIVGDRGQRTRLPGLEVRDYPFAKEANGVEHLLVLGRPDGAQ